jgi:hypothetical protein
MSFKSYIWGNIIEAMKSVCDAADLFGYKERIGAKDAYTAVTLAQISDGTTTAAAAGPEPQPHCYILYADLTPDLGQSIAELWADQAIQETWDRRSEFQVVRCTIINKLHNSMGCTCKDRTRDVPSRAARCKNSYKRP